MHRTSVVITRCEFYISFMLRDHVMISLISLLSFLLIEGAWDNAEVWTALTADQRTSIKSEYAAAGISLMVSAFGSTDVPTTSGVDPVAIANTMSAWVKQYDLDGIDVDYEDFDAMKTGNGRHHYLLCI